MIAITGANGNIGRQLARLIVAAGRAARLLVRDPARADTFGGALTITEADLDRPDTLVPALAGIEQLFLLSPGPDTPTQDSAAIAAARHVGVRHIVLLSSLGVEVGGVGGGRSHAPGEVLLQDSGLDWTILRPSEFMTNTLRWLPEIAARGTVSVPSGEGAVGFIDPSDIAAVAFAALTAPGQSEKIYRVTGPEALSIAEVVARIGTVLGRPVRHSDVSDVTFRTRAREAHLPEAMIETLSEYYDAVKGGRMAILTPDVEQITGRRPGTFLDWARANIVAAS